MATDTFRSEYKPLIPGQSELILDIKGKAQELYDLFSLIDNGSPESLSTNGREVSLSRTNLEQAVMWAVKGVTA